MKNVVIIILSLTINTSYSQNKNTFYLDRRILVDKIDSLFKTNSKAIHYLEWDSIITYQIPSGYAGYEKKQSIDDSFYLNSNNVYLERIQFSSMDSIQKKQMFHSLDNPNLYKSTVFWIKDPVEGWEFINRNFKLDNIHFPVCISLWEEKWFEWYLVSFAVNPRTGLVTKCEMQKLGRK